MKNAKYAQKGQTRFWSGQKSRLEIQALQGWPLNITIQIRVLEINLLGFDITNFYNHIQNGNLPISCY